MKNNIYVRTRKRRKKFFSKTADQSDDAKKFERKSAAKQRNYGDGKVRAPKKPKFPPGILNRGSGSAGAAAVHQSVCRNFYLEKISVISNESDKKEQAGKID